MKQAAVHLVWFELVKDLHVCVLGRLQLNECLGVSEG